MIESNRLRNIYDETKYHQMKKYPRCLGCHKNGIQRDSLFLCVDCKMKCYCEECDRAIHAEAKKAVHKRRRITIGRPYKVKTLIDGDGFTYPKVR